MQDENYLVVDTETTGWRKSGKKIQDGQARVCQVAMLLINSQGKPLAAFSSLIKPDGWKISDSAKEAHGFSDEDCKNFGVHVSFMIHSFNHMADRATKIIAHHADFDKGMMDIEAAYFTKTENPATRKPWYCTQENSINLCRLPPTEKMKAAGRHHFKTPSLAEALKILTGRDIGEGAHDAMNDAIACRDVFFAIRGGKAA